MAEGVVQDCARKLKSTMEQHRQFTRFHVQNRQQSHAVRPSRTGGPEEIQTCRYRHLNLPRTVLESEIFYGRASD